MTTLPTGFKPAFSRVAQEENFDCVFSCIAMLSKTTLKEVKQQAIVKGMMPKNGPYWISETMIATLLASHKLVATVYKEFDSNTVPDVCILMIDYNPESELGRHVLFHRASVPDTKGGNITVEYVIDPAYWIEPGKHVQPDWKALKPAWWIGVHPMGAALATKPLARS